MHTTFAPPVDTIDLARMELELALDAEHDDGGNVSFTVKELFASIDRKLDDRVTKDDFARLDVKVDALESRVGAQELHWARVVGITAGVSMVVSGGFFTLLHSLHP